MPKYGTMSARLRAHRERRARALSAGIGSVRSRPIGTASASSLATALSMVSTAIPSMRYGDRGFQHNLHRFLRWRETTDPGSPITVSCNFNAAGFGAANVQSFLFRDVANVTELSTLYDMYRIDRVELWFDYTPDTPSLNTAIPVFPKLWIRRDYDGQDPTTLTIRDFEQSNQSQCLRFGSDSLTKGPYYIRPALSNRVFTAAAGGAVSASPMWGQWLDTANAASREVPHFGVSMLAQGLPGQDLGAITVRVRYHLSMKNVR